MSQMGTYTTEKLGKFFKNHGISFRKRTASSHLQFTGNGQSGTLVADREFKPGTVRQILDDQGLDLEEFLVFHHGEKGRTIARTYNKEPQAEETAQTTVEEQISEEENPSRSPEKSIEKIKVLGETPIDELGLSQEVDAKCKSLNITRIDELDSMRRRYDISDNTRQELDILFKYITIDYENTKKVSTSTLGPQIRDTSQEYHEHQRKREEQVAQKDEKKKARFEAKQQERNGQKQRATFNQEIFKVYNKGELHFDFMEEFFKKIIDNYDFIPSRKDVKNLFKLVPNAKTIRGLESVVKDYVRKKLGKGRKPTIGIDLLQSLPPTVQSWTLLVILSEIKEITQVETPLVHRIIDKIDIDALGMDLEKVNKLLGEVETTKQKD